jgi:hypothetical protein
MKSSNSGDVLSEGRVGCFSHRMAFINCQLPSFVGNGSFPEIIVINVMPRLHMSASKL